MKKYFSVSRACAVFMSALSLSAAAAAEQGGDELVLKGPGDTRFEFVKVKVNGGSGPYAGQSFTMGDPTGTFRTPPTAIVISGGFSDSENRYFYMSKYEITEAQYSAVTGRESSKDPQLPVTGVSWYEVQQFTDQLNRYVYEHELASMPKAGTYPGFVRLPTEEEWEFAARGGTAVKATVFDADTPYDEEKELAAYEWFSGPSSSHNKIQKVGKLKPNPLGLYDMLGNVQEMTSSLYRVEYYQGRSGGFAARGGHYLTEEEDMVSSRRTEEPFYLGTAEKGMKPNSKPTLGFRLVISAPVMTDNKAIAELEKNWDSYRRGIGSKTPAALSVADTATKENVSANEALNRLDRIGKVLEEAGLKDSLKKELEGTRSALLDMVKVRRKADEDSASVWVKIACERGMYLSHNLKAYEIVKDAPTEKLRKRAEEFAYNLESGFENYGEIMTELVKLPDDAVLSGFERFSKDLEQDIQKASSGDKSNREQIVKDLTEQSLRVEITKKHYKHYREHKRLDVPLWKTDYLN